jgi:hypothetical protein
LLDNAKLAALTVTAFPVGTTSVAHVDCVVLRQPVPASPTNHGAPLVSEFVVEAVVFDDDGVVVLLVLE